MKWMALAMMLALTSCSTDWQGDPQLHGLALELEGNGTNAAWAHREDLKPRLRRSIELAASHWGAEADVVAGWRLVLSDAFVSCGAHAAASGCTTPEDRTMTVTATVAVCVESTALMHEIGHLVLGDPNHSDPRWHDVDAMRQTWDRMHLELKGPPDCGGELYTGQWQGF